MKTTIITMIAAIGILSSCSNTLKEKENFTIEKGVNVSHWLSQTEMRGNSRAAYMTEKDFALIAEMGFDHVRIPVDEMHLWDEEGNKHEDAFKLLHNAIKWAFDNDLRVIVDLHVIRSHHFNAKDNTLWTDPLEQEKFWGFWEELSSELKKYPNHLLAYELMNEAVAEDPEDWNNLIAKGIEVVRKKEPARKIVVGSNKWQQVHTFPDLKVPEGDTNIILSFHFYDPFIFTHYQTHWSYLKDFEAEVNYPGWTVDTSVYSTLEGEMLERIRNDNGYADLKVLEERILIARQVADQLGLPLYCGEFGCYPSTAIDARVRLYSSLMAIFKRHNIAWSHWNYKNDFPVVDAKTLMPIDEIFEVLTAD